MKLVLTYITWVVSICESVSKNLAVVYRESPQGGYAIYGPLVAENIRMTAIVDTGITASLLVWKEWYEGVLGSGACKNFILGCFPCPGNCTRGPRRSFKARGVELLAGGYRAEIFTVRDISFGLIDGQDPTPRQIPSANYLGLKPDNGGSGFSLMNQLRDKKVLKTATFTIFLRPTDRPDVFSGKLILGGVDPTQYMIPLRYVPLLSIDDYVVNLHSMAIQEGITTLDIDQKVTIHTGDNYVGIPHRYASGLVEKLASAASNIRGQRVDIVFDERIGNYMIDCSLREYMPTLTFYLGPDWDVPLEIHAIDYVRRYVRTLRCTIMIKTVPGNTWEFPAGTLIGNYIEFHPVEMILGIAKLKPHA